MSNSKQIQARLRTVWQHQKHVSYCLFGSKHHLMSSIFLHRSMPFFQFGDTISLNKIATEDWVEYIVSHFADGKEPLAVNWQKRFANLPRIILPTYNNWLGWFLH